MLHSFYVGIGLEGFIAWDTLSYLSDKVAAIEEPLKGVEYFKSLKHVET